MHIHGKEFLYRADPIGKENDSDSVLDVSNPAV